MDFRATTRFEGSQKFFRGLFFVHPPEIRKGFEGAAEDVEGVFNTWRSLLLILLVSLCSTHFVASSSNWTRTAL